MAMSTRRTRRGERIIRCDNKRIYPKLHNEFEAPERLVELLSKPPVCRREQLKYSWNPKDSSPNIHVLESDVLTCERDPFTDSTDCIRGKVGFREGFHVWEIHWPTHMRGRYAIVGIATELTDLVREGYENWIGYDSTAWGWDIVRNQLLHDSRFNPPIPYPVDIDPYVKFKVPDRFLVAMDMDEGVLSFIMDGLYLGEAFHNFHCQTIFPIISTVCGRAQITMTYLGGLEPFPWHTERITYVIRRKPCKSKGEEMSKPDKNSQLNSSIQNSIPSFLAQQNNNQLKNCS